MITISDITAVPDWQTKSPAEILVYFSTIEPVRRSQTRYSEKGLKDKFGVVRVATWAVTVKALAVALEEAGDTIGAEIARSNWEILRGDEGVDFASPQTVAFIEQLESLGKITAQDAVDLKSLGYDYKTNWQRLHGATPMPTESDIASAKQLASTHEWFREKSADALRDIESGSLVTKADVLDFLSGTA